MTSLRRKSRILAIQALYEIDSTGHDVESTLNRLLEEKSLPEEATAYTQDIVRGIRYNQIEIDEIIQKSAPAFPIEQLAIIDRNILRLAIFEILLNNEVPVKVAINEAVDLAKLFGSDNSFKFVNGVLGAVLAAFANRVKGRQKLSSL